MKFKAICLALALALGLNANAAAAPASGARVAGGMLMGIGVPLAVIGLQGIGHPDTGSILGDWRALSFGLAAGGTAAAALGLTLWVKAGPAPGAVVSWSY